MAWRGCRKSLGDYRNYVFNKNLQNDMKFEFKVGHYDRLTRAKRDQNLGINFQFSFRKEHKVVVGI